MKTIEIEAGKIKPNPFKKYINKGILNDEGVKKMEESIEHGTLPEHFTVRDAGEGYELCYGHHRLQALRNKKGKDYVVTCTVVDYPDETMLIDLVRENLTQRDNDFRDSEDSVVLARQWLQSKVQLVKQFYKLYPQIQKGKKGFQNVNGSSRDIAKFLSKQGKTISHETVANYLNIHDNLDSSLHSKVARLEHTPPEISEKGIGVRVASRLASIKNKKDQRLVVSKIKKERLNQSDAEKAITKFKQIKDEGIKDLVRKGAVNLSDLKDETGLIAKAPPTEAEYVSKFKAKFQEARGGWVDVLLKLRLTEVLSSYDAPEISRILSDIRDANGEAGKTYDRLEKYIKSKEVKSREVA